MKAPKKQKNSIDVVLNNMTRKPEEWRVDRYRARHRSGVSIWIGNGLINYHVEPPHAQELSWRERLKLRKALEILREKQPEL